MTRDTVAATYVVCVALAVLIAIRLITLAL